MTDTGDAVRIDARNQLTAACAGLCVAARPFGGAVGLELSIADDLADGLLHGALHLVA
jgi:hypothetical protein